ncbi:MAG TPA: EAL domain-containing protein [Luteimonas sp.]|jgi:diguanylate cyclase (GGDEF)-like protein|nr:EAL domain-containing protein [Luteimonas sp.]
MGFRFRLASFIVATLIGVQALTAVLVYEVTRHELIGEGQRQLAVAAGAFARQLDDISERVASSVQVLSLDYALRAAIAQRDEATLLSALHNHGRRVGATQMLVLDVDGRIEADTDGAYPNRSRFPYTDLVNRALDKPAAAVVASRGRASWMVVVPVFAPDLVGFIAAAIPVDDARLAQLQQQSALPRSVELATLTPQGWRVLARGRDSIPLARQLTMGQDALPRQPKLTTVAGREYVAQAVWLNRSRQSAPVVAVLGYSVDEALSPYRRVGLAWAGLLSLGLLVGLFGAWLIARSVSRPVEQLAASAGRIEAGDYSVPPSLPRRDEIGALSTAFATMAQSIREREAHILFQAGHDPVTALPNRIAASTAIQRELAASRGRHGALLLIGLGRLQEIARTMGHAVCDRLMQDAARRLRGPAGDALLARATDAEFLLFLPAASKSDAVAAGFRMVEALAEPYREAEFTLDLAPVAGIALAPVHGADTAELMRHAGVALIAALRSEDPVAIYDPGTDPHRPERLSLMGDLRIALEHGHMQMFYQPKLHLASGRIDAAEALARWEHPSLGAIRPDDFIVLAEETGNIRRLTRWALAAGIAQASRWRDPAIRVSINISARDLDDAGLPRRISELLSAHALPAERIALEVTESAIMHKPDAAIAVLDQVAALGIDVAIDDFGVGQSSFAYLRRLPVRELKIDKAFVAQLAGDRQDRTIVRSIVDLGHRLGCRVTAEGVEDPESLAYLAGIGCDHAQGFLIARALPVPAFEQMLDEPPRRRWA